MEKTTIFWYNTKINYTRNTMGGGNKQEQLESQKNTQKIETDLKAYFDRQKEANLKPDEIALRKRFLDNVNNWDQAGDKRSIRTAGLNSSEALKNSDLHHAILAEVFMKRIEGDGVRFKIDFKGNQTAEDHLGLGELLPHNAKKIIVTKPDGTKIEAVRMIHPTKHRPCYCRTDALPKMVVYVPVFSGDEVEIKETGEATESVAMVKENVEFFNRGGADATRMNEDIPSPTIDNAKKTVAVTTRSNLAAFRANPDTYKAPTATGVPFARPALKERVSGAPVGREFYSQAFCGYNHHQIVNDPEIFKQAEKNMQSWIINKDPITGGPVTFLGYRMPGGMNMALYPIFKQIEHDMEAEGIDYRMTDGGSFSWRKTSRGDGTKNNTMSFHAFGAAIDINPRRNPDQREEWRRYKAGEHPPVKTDFPRKMIGIMAKYGFTWLGDSTGDAMHFDYRTQNPFIVSDLITDDHARKCLVYAQKMHPEKYKSEPIRDVATGNMAATQTANSPKPQESAVATTTPESGWSGVRADRRVPAESPSTRAVFNISAEKIESRIGRYNEIIARASKTYGVPENVIKAIIMQESGGSPRTASSAGAGGLMALMPQTARSRGMGPILPVVDTGKKGYLRYELDPADGRANPEACIMAGTAVFASILKTYGGDYKTALCAYNWGSGNLEKYFQGRKKMPQETAFYYKNISSYVDKLDRLHGNEKKTEEPSGQPLA